MPKLSVKLSVMLITIRKKTVGVRSVSCRSSIRRKGRAPSIAAASIRLRGKDCSAARKKMKL